MIVKEWPQLYALASTGKIKCWKIWITDESNKICIKTEHGLLGKKQIISSKEIKSGKNLGKKNETTKLEQAISDAQSVFNKKTDEKYTEDPSGIGKEHSDVLLPMLAQKYRQRKKHVKFPCWVQPKLNGVRCIAKVKDGNVTYWSRKGKEFTTLQHINEDIIKLSRGKDIVFDGELFNPSLSFQDITRRVKKYRPMKTEDIQYWIYDIPVENVKFNERSTELEAMFMDYVGNEREDIKTAVNTQTVFAENEEDIMRYHAKFCELGFEGTIIRNTDGLYKFDHRSNDLLKYKDWLDAEFEIVDCLEGTGLEEGCAVFRCKTKENKTFEVRPRGTRDKRKQWFNDMNNIIGKELTVRYQYLSEDGIPIFPVGIEIRDYE